MQDENKTPAVLKKDLPDELYPGVPIAGAGSEAPAPQAEEAVPPKPTPEEAKNKEEKILIGELIFKILFCLNIYFIYEFFRKSFSAFDQMRESGISEGTIATLTKIMLFFAPLFFFVVLAVFARLLIGCSVGKKAAEFVIIMSLFHGFVKLAYFANDGTGIFLSALAISASLSEVILTYDGGGLLRHIARQIKCLWTKFIPKGL